MVILPSIRPPQLNFDLNASKAVFIMELILARIQVTVHSLAR